MLVLVQQHLDSVWPFRHFVRLKKVWVRHLAEHYIMFISYNQVICTENIYLCFQYVCAEAHLLWHIYCGTSTVAHLLWHICCGTSAVAHLLWHIYCGTSTVAHLLWHISCGTSTVAHLL